MEVLIAGEKKMQVHKPIILSCKFENIQRNEEWKHAWLRKKEWMMKKEKGREGE